ncbi:hypothetical protein [Streptomyces sp. NBC_00525]|uniref:hypothetical protein n=1 Tax=Streptomyces sp. NBC_00525 TaxID=2903660 RepID=UPI002E8040A4|nr:hypothetical protein [Streptomyces sp. NBC_00525]WUC95077.1 hypothetical protein OG710_16450 [Streptomyces sp. NBC_00525]
MTTTLLAKPSSPPLGRLVRAELHRILGPKPIRYGLYALPVILLALAVSAFVGHHTDVAAAWRAAEAAYRTYAQEAATRPAGSVESLSPREFFDDPRYLMAKASFVDLRAVLSGLSLAALVLGVLSGGADWSSRVMLTLTAAEPRRTRLFLTRGLLVTVVATGVGLLATVFFVPLLLGVAHFKGSLDGADGRYWTVLAVVGARGAVLVGLMALLGYALAMLTRRTTTALGIALLYLVASARVVQEYAPDLAAHQLSGITFAVLNERLLMETDRTTCFGEAACLAMREGTTATTAFLALAVHLIPVVAAAWWRFARRDVG